MVVKVYLKFVKKHVQWLKNFPPFVQADELTVFMSSVKTFEE